MFQIFATGLLIGITFLVIGICLMMQGCSRPVAKVILDPSAPVSCHPRESGDPEVSVACWIPGQAGDDNSRGVHDFCNRSSDAKERFLVDGTKAEFLREKFLEKLRSHGLSVKKEDGKAELYSIGNKRFYVKIRSEKNGFWGAIPKILEEKDLYLVFLKGTNDHDIAYGYVLPPDEIQRKTEKWHPDTKCQYKINESTDLRDLEKIENLDGVVEYIAAIAE